MSHNRRLSSLILFTPCLMGWGCTSHQTIFVPPGIPVRLAETIERARVFAPNGKGEWVPATATLRAGMIVTYDPAEWPLPERAKDMDVKPR